MSKGARRKQEQSLYVRVPYESFKFKLNKPRTILRCDAKQNQEFHIHSNARCRLNKVLALHFVLAELGNLSTPPPP